MKNNFKFLIVFAILLTACICIGSTFAADVSVNDIDNATDLEIAHGDSSQKAVELNNLYVEKTSFNQDNGVVLLNSDNRAIVNGNTFEDIQKSITSSNMEIYLHNQTYTGSSQINITHDNITIYGGNSAGDGLSSTLDAKGLCRIMYLSNSVKTITFVNIRFINGNADKGGAIYVDSNVTISGVNTSFVGNNATDKGGAIYVYKGGSLCISGVNTSFNDNFAFYGGAIYSYNSDVTINGNDTEFRGNSAKESGGVIYVYSASMCISGVNTSFINNNAPLSGGAIYVDSPFVYSASMCISGVNTIFRGNTAQRGGAIFSYNGNLTINGNDTKFISNSANSDTMGGGGAIYTMKEGILCISGVNTSFIDNYVNDSNPFNYSFGGAICIDSGIMCISGVNTSFRGNFAGFGGAIYVSDDNSTIEGAIFINNVASYDVFAGEVGGGAVYIAGNYTTLKNCTFRNNTASGLGIEKSYHGTEGGSAVLVSGNNNTIDSCIFINNTVFSADGNYSGEEGGAVFVCGNYTTLKNCTFNNNDAPCAGAVFVCGNYTMIEWCNFTNNVAVGNGIFDGGGAIYLYTSSDGLSNCTIINCNFINNYVNGSTNSGGTKTTDGGAIYSNMDYVTISYSYFEGNFAQMGGAIRMHGNGDYPIHHCSFTGNRAVERGGAVYLADSIFRNLTDCNFTNNSVIGSKSFGGAINIQLGMINNCNFINNSAHYGAGGAIMWDHTYAATEDGGFANNCTFIQNTAHQGSAIYFDNVVNSITLTDVNFINNTADSDHIDISCNQSEGAYNFTISHYGFNNILDAIYFKCSDSTTKNITINNVTYDPSNENAPRTTVITNVTFIYFEGIETQRVDSGHPYVLNTTNSTNKHLIKVIATYDGPLYTYISNSISFNYETEISIGDFSGLTLSNVTSTVNIHIKGDSNATINNTTVNVTLSFELNDYEYFTYNYTNVDVIDGKMTLLLPTLNRTNNVTATLKIEFNGNSTYNASNGTTTLNISKRETTMDVSVISDHGNFEFYVKLPENATGTVYIFGDNYKFNDKANLTNGTAHFNIPNLTPGNYESHFTYDGDDYFKSHSQYFNFTIPTVNIVINPDIISFGENVTINCNVTGLNDIIPTGNVTIVIYNENYSNTVVKTLSDGEVNCIISGLETGVYYVNVTYNGDDSYLPSMNNTIFVVVDIVDIGVNASGVYDGRITGSINVTCDGIITFIIGEDNFTGSVVDGEFSVVIKGVDAKTYECVHVVFVSDDGGVGATVINLTISPKIISLKGFIFDAYSGTNLTGILVTDGKTGNVNITIDGVVYSGFVDWEGHFVINDTDSLTAGNYDNIVLGFVSEDGNCFGNMTVSFIIMDAPTIDDAIVSGNYSETVSFNITVHNAQSGDIVVLHLPDGTNITGKLYVEEGKVEFTTVLPYACNDITTDVIYIRDGVSCAVGNVTWNINKIDTNITLVSENVSIIAGTVKEVEVSVVDSYGNLVTQGQINVTGIGVTLMDSMDGIYDLVDGKVTIKFKYAEEGNYVLNIKYLGGVATNNTDNYYTSDKNLNVFVSSKVLNTYIVSDYNGNNAFEGKIGEQLTLNFTVYDKNGKSVNGGNLSIVLGGKVYTAPVINGHVSITNESFIWTSTGLYVYVVNYISDNDVYADSFNFTSINIPKVATHIEIEGSINDTNKHLVIKILGEDGAYVTKGIVYYVSPDGIEHNITVNGSSIELDVPINRTGTYEIAVSYIDLDGDYLYSSASFNWNVQLTTTLSKVNNSADGLLVTIKVADENGNGANGKVDLFVNGKLMTLNIVNGVGSANIGHYNGPVELNAVFTGEDCLSSYDKVIIECINTPENAIDHDEIEEINSLETDSDNNTEDNSTDVNDEFSDVNDDESSENSVKKSFVSGIPMEHTAIPILALLIALITLPIIRRRK